MTLPGRLRLLRPLRLKAALRSHAPSCPPPGRPRAMENMLEPAEKIRIMDGSAEASGTMFDLLAGKKAQLRSHKL